MCFLMVFALADELVEAGGACLRPAGPLEEDLLALPGGRREFDGRPWVGLVVTGSGVLSSSARCKRSLTAGNPAAAVC